MPWLDSYITITVNILVLLILTLILIWSWSFHILIVRMMPILILTLYLNLPLIGPTLQQIHPCHPHSIIPSAPKKTFHLGKIGNGVQYPHNRCATSISKSVFQCTSPLQLCTVHSDGMFVFSFCKQMIKKRKKNSLRFFYCFVPALAPFSCFGISFLFLYTWLYFQILHVQCSSLIFCRCSFGCYINNLPNDSHLEFTSFLSLFVFVSYHLYLDALWVWFTF